jgi:hypothetical protein
MIAIDRLRDIGSDHFPIFFRLCLDAPAGQRRVAPAAAADAEIEASAEVKEGHAERNEEDRGR